MQFLWKYIDDLVGKGLDASIIVELLFYASANLVPLALPLAILLASIMTFGSLGEHYELVALKSAGLSLQRIMLPLTIFIIFSGVGAFFFSNYVWPVANLKFATLLHDVTHKKPAIDIQDKAFYRQFDGFVIRVDRNDKKAGILHDVLIYDHREKNGNKKVIRAKKGTMNMDDNSMIMEFVLEDGYSYHSMKGEEAPHFKSTFKKEVVRFDLAGFEFNRSDEDRFKDNYKMLNLRQLELEMDTLRDTRNKRFSDFDLKAQTFSKMTDTIKMQPVVVPASKAESILADIDDEKLKKVYSQAINSCRSHKTFVENLNREIDGRTRYLNRFEIEWHRKFTLSVACVVLFFIGAPMGAIIRKGGLGMPVIVAIIFFLVFHISSITGEKLVKQGEMEVFNGMWLSTFILTPLGLFLTYKASTDSKILDLEFYQRLIGRILGRKQE